MNYRKFLLSLGSFIVLSNSAFQANAAILLENPASVTYQQTESSPCIFNNSSCNNPVGFSSTLIPTGPSGENYDLYSPVLTANAYTVGQIRTLLGGDTFMVGIDVNTARTTPTNTQYPLASETLNFFNIQVNGAIYDQFTTPTQLYSVSNGNGYSDHLLTGFTLAGLANSDLVRFEVSISNATDGREQFFLISTANPGGPPTELPEPGTSAIFGLGLLGMGMISLRRKKQS